MPASESRRMRVRSPETAISSALAEGDRCLLLMPAMVHVSNAGVNSHLRCLLSPWCITATCGAMGKTLAQRVQAALDAFPPPRPKLRELERRAGVGAGLISRVLNNGRQPSLENVRKLEAVLGVSLATDEPPEPPAAMATPRAAADYSEAARIRDVLILREGLDEETAGMLAGEAALHYDGRAAEFIDLYRRALSLARKRGLVETNARPGEDTAGAGGPSPLHQRSGSTTARARRTLERRTLRPFDEALSPQRWFSSEPTVDHGVRAPDEHPSPIPIEQPGLPQSRHGSTRGRLPQLSLRRPGPVLQRTEAASSAAPSAGAVNKKAGRPLLWVRSCIVLTHAVQKSINVPSNGGSQWNSQKRSSAP